MPGSVYKRGEIYWIKFYYKPTLSRCKTRKNLLPSAACFYGRLRTIQGRSRDGLGPC